MLRRRADGRGLAEIVGTLMLVLIVVSAAVAFSFFVASYQAQLQQEQTLAHDKALESLVVLSVAPNLIPNGHPGWFASLNFTFASEYINPSAVTEISIDDHPVKTYTVTALDLQTGIQTTAPVPPAAELNLTPREQATVWVNFTGPSPSFYTPFVLSSADYVKVDLFTAYQNDFSRVFIPPTAVAVVTTTNTSGTATTLLDGTMSFQPEGNGTIVAWAWNVTNTSGSPPLFSFVGFGEEVQTPSALTVGSYTVTLTVTNSYGLTGVTKVLYVVP